MTAAPGPPPPPAPAAEPRGRGTPQRAAPAHGLGLPRRRPDRGADPGPDDPGRGAPVGRRDARAAGPPGRQAAARATTTCWPARATCRGATWAAGPSRQRALGRQPGQPVGLLHTGRPHHPALHPAAGDAGLGRRLRAGARAGAPAGARPRAGLLGRGRRATRAPSGPGATSRASRRPPGWGCPTTTPDDATSRPADGSRPGRRR